VIIRAARGDEAHAVRELVQRAYGVYVERIGRRPAPMDDDYADKIDRGQVEIADLDGTPIGVLVLIPGDGHLLVENVAVDPSHQGRGVGRALLGHAERTAAQLGLPELRLYTNAAMTENLELYPELGYREVVRKSDDGFERVFFAKPTPSAA
jgi:GNAT superfamily N-acetyltransferase